MMEFTGQIIPLPLPNEIQRCLAHGQLKGEWCDRADHCARHLTLRLDAPPVASQPVAAYRACTSDLMAGYMPMDGYLKDDVQ